MGGMGRHGQRRMPGGTWERKRSWRSRRRTSEMHWFPCARRKGSWRRRGRAAQVRDESHTQRLFSRRLHSGPNYECVCVCVCSGNSVEKQLAELETLCKQKEEERVELELRLTEVKENLKKSLARGALGPPTDTKINVKVGSKHTHLFTAGTEALLRKLLMNVL